jgi:hypothetical protein
MTQKSWTGQKAWKDWSGTLAVSTGDDFQRKVLRLLRLLWPEMQEAPRLKHWDRKGIDLFVWADNGPFPCVVQCKGFEVQTIGANQTAQALRSIECFKQSDAVAVTYLIVHNRDGSNRDCAVRVEAALADLVKAGKAQKAMLWDRQRVVNELFWHMETLLLSALHQSSRELFEHFQRLFRFGSTQINIVPADEHELTLSRTAPPLIRQTSSTCLKNIPNFIRNSSGTRWTMITGIFGMGKTTAALCAATSAEIPVLFLPASSVPYPVLTGGMTNQLTRHVVESLALLESIEVADKDEFYGVAASVLSYLLRDKNSTFLFILDGLDENQALTTIQGLQRLSNQIAEFACPVVLTTRQEHLYAMMGDFNVAMGELSTKFGRRGARVLQLQRWTTSQTEQLVDAAVNETTGGEQDRLKVLSRMVKDGSAETAYGQLLYHPLFLQFILEDVVEAGVRASNRVYLLGSWVRRKILRDRITWVPRPDSVRVGIDETMDTEEFIGYMMRALEHVAYEMTVKGTFVLKESLSGVEVTSVIAEVFGKPVKLLPILLNSVLVPLTARKGEFVPVGFALRILHEYFLASYLSRYNLDPSSYPSDIQALTGEIEDQLQCATGTRAAPLQIT